MSFTSLNQLLVSRFGQTPLAKQVSAALICDEFNSLILNIWGDKIKNQAQAVYFKNNILTVAVLSSVVAQELKLQEAKLIRELNAKFGPGTIQNLRILT